MSTTVLRHGDSDVFDLFHGLLEGDPYMVFALLLIVGAVISMATYQAITGQPFVKSKKERRRARERRGTVIWRYERDDF